MRLGGYSARKTSTDLGGSKATPARAAIRQRLAELREGGGVKRSIEHLLTQLRNAVKRCGAYHDRVVRHP